MFLGDKIERNNLYFHSLISQTKYSCSSSSFFSNVSHVTRTPSNNNNKTNINKHVFQNRRIQNENIKSKNNNKKYK